MMSSILYSLFARFVLFLEPISPRFVSFLIRRRLNVWKREGVIDGFKVQTRRVGRFHYKVVVDLDFTPFQARHVMTDALTRLSRVRRR
jgi:hypothetical protein